MAQYCTHDGSRTTESVALVRSLRAMKMVILGVTALISTLPSPALLGDEADDLIRRFLRETPNRAEAAKELVASAKTMSDSPAAQMRLCEKAYELGVSLPAGYPSAVASLDQLVKIAPSRAAEWDDKRLEVYRLWYFRGDRKDKIVSGRKYLMMLLAKADRSCEDSKWSDGAKLYLQAYGVARALKLPEKPSIQQRMRYASHMATAYRRVTALKTAIQKNPGDSYSRKRLVETYLIDLDMPTEASKHLGDKLDAVLRKNVSLASRQASDLADADFLTLGDWYRSLAVRTSVKKAKARLLARARNNLKMFLEVYPKKDVKWLDVQRTLKLVEAELKQLAVVPSRTSGHVQSSDAAFVANFSRNAEAKLKRGGLLKGTLHGNARIASAALDLRRGGHVTFGHRPEFDLVGGFSVECWAYFDPNCGKAIIVDCGNWQQAGWYLERDRRLRWYVGGVVCDGGSAPAGKWTHLVGTHDGHTARLFQNGRLVATKGQKARRDRWPGPLYIGQFHDGRFQTVGAIRGVRIHDRALTAEDVAAAFQGKPLPTRPKKRPENKVREAAKALTK